MDNKNTNTMLDIFKRLGIPERESRVLIVLNGYNDGLKQKDICVYGYIYQPEVSLGLKNLMYKGWVTIVDRVKTDNKGRPFSIYALSKSFGEIIDEIDFEITCEYESTIFDIERLKKIA